MDYRRAGAHPHEPVSLNSRGEPGRVGRIAPESPARASPANRQSGSQTAGTTLGPVPPSLWAQSRLVGWADAGHSPEAAVRHPVESAAGAAVDAPIRLSAKTSGVHLPASPRQGCQAVSAQLKKNSTPWDRPRPWPCKMKRDSPSIPGWGLAGRSSASGCACPGHTSARSSGPPR